MSFMERIAHNFLFIKLGIPLLIVLIALILLPSARIFASNVISDTFSRTTSNGWGTADSGGSWSVSGGASSDFNVGSGVGTMAVQTANSNRYASIFSLSQTNSDIKIKFKTDKLAAGGSQAMFLRARTTGGGDYYSVQVTLTTSHTVQISILKFISGVQTTITSVTTIPELAHAANRFIQVRFQASGTTPTTLRAKAWIDGGKEPTLWHVSTTDSSATLQASGYNTVRSFVNSGASNAPVTFTYDNYTYDNSPTDAPTAPGLAGSSENKGANWHFGPWYNTSFDPNAYYYQGIYNDLDHMHTAGIKWVRLSLNQSTQTTCTAGGTYSKIRDALSARNMEALIIVTIPSATTTTATAGQISSYNSWLTTMVNCYKDDFKYWEIHNEPDSHYYWNIDETTVDNAAYTQSVGYYVTYLQNSYSTIKGIDSSATVIMGGLTQVYYSRFLDEIVSQNAGGYMDALAFHPYSDNGPNGSLNYLNSFYAKTQESVQLSSKPIYITELGYTSDSSEFPGNVGLGGETTKASYLSDVYQKILDWGITTPIFWYDYAQDDTLGTTGYELENTNRTTLESTYRAAYTAMQNLWPEQTSSSSPPTILQITNSQSHISTPNCDVAPPGRAPYLFQIDTTKDTAKLYFTSGGTNTTHHILSYGYSSNAEQFGIYIPINDFSGVFPYTVNYLSPSTIYYFKVRGGNGCKPGQWSSTLKVKTNSKYKTKPTLFYPFSNK